jgi:hypothetical protein
MIKTFKCIKELFKTPKPSDDFFPSQEPLLLHLADTGSLGIPMLVTWAARTIPGLNLDSVFFEIDFDCRGSVESIIRELAPDSTTSAGDNTNIPTDVPQTKKELTVIIRCGEIKASDKGTSLSSTNKLLQMYCCIEF